MARSLLRLSPAAFCLLLVAPALAQAPQPPQWLQDINPADYALLAADLPAGMSLWGEIEAEANATEVGITDAQGRTTVQQVVHFVLTQAIKVEREDFVEGVSIYLAMFSTPDECIAFTRRHFGDYGMNPDWMVNANELGDRRIPTNGGSVAGPGRAIIRYRNMVASFSWNGRVDDFGTQKTAQVAKLWLNKVAGPPGADLVMAADNIILKHWQDHANREREPAADRQYVSAWLRNDSPDVTAKNVRARLSVQLEGEAEYTVIGAPVLIGDVAPGVWASAEFEWDLMGQNVVDANLKVDVWAEGPQDLDPRNNSAGIRCSIYYAHNGAAAYRWLEDSYQFSNYGYKGRELEELTQGLLATVIGQLYTDPKATELLQHLLFPQTYMRFFEYLHKGIQSGAGGHCYGMAATAGLYFMDPSTSPGGTSTWNLTDTVAGPNINLYQRAQMVPLAEALLKGDTWMEANWGTVVSLNSVRHRLRGDRTPMMLLLAGTRKVQEEVIVNGQPQQQMVDKRWGHAVLAYKVVDVFNRYSTVYVYDPNVPPSLQWGGQAPMSAISINPRDGGRDLTSDMKPHYIRPAGHAKGEMTLNWIGAAEVTREISVAESNALMPVLREKLKEMAQFLEKGNQVAKKLTMAVLRCPADVVFTDPQGRRVGFSGGQLINEIPGAEIRTSGEVEIYILPADVPLTVAITGTGAGTAGFDIIRPENGEPALVSFQQMPVSAGSSITGTLPPGGALASLSGAGVTHAPALLGTLSGDRVTWQEPGGPTTPTTPITPTEPGTPGAPSATLVICAGHDEGEPIGASDTFDPPTPAVYGVLHFANQPPATVTRIWMRDGREITRGEGRIEGTGWAWGWLHTDAPEGLEPGAYELIWQVGDRALARRAFTIGQAPYVTPAPAAAQSWTFAEPSGSRQAEIALPAAGGELTLQFRYSQPGTLLDTVGILAAPDGSFCLTIFEDGTVTWQIMNRAAQSGVRHATGWHYLTGYALLEPGRWHAARVTWGAGGMKLFVDDLLIAADPVVLTLADMPLFFGDFPADGRPMGFVGEIRNVNVTAVEAGEG